MWVEPNPAMQVRRHRQRRPSKQIVMPRISVRNLGFSCAFVLIIACYGIFQAVEYALRPSSSHSPARHFQEQARAANTGASPVRSPSLLSAAMEGGRLQLWQGLGAGRELSVSADELQRILRRTKEMDAEDRNVTASQGHDDGDGGGGLPPRGAKGDSVGACIPASAGADRSRADELLACTDRMPKLRLAGGDTAPPFAVIKTSTQPPFLMVVPAEGEHSEFLLEHMRSKEGNYAFAAEAHGPMGEAVRYVLKESQCATAEGRAHQRPHVTLDGGAYLGFFALLFASRGCDAVAVEPQSSVLPCRRLRVTSKYGDQNPELTEIHPAV